MVELPPEDGLLGVADDPPEEADVAVTVALATSSFAVPSYMIASMVALPALFMRSVYVPLPSSRIL